VNRKPETATGDGTMSKHLYRRFGTRRLIEMENPNALRNMEYVGTLRFTEYDGRRYWAWSPQPNGCGGYKEASPQELARFGWTG
jgi:hypothetical protein